MAGELRARDIRFKLKGVIDPRLLETLETLAEQQHQLAKNQTEIALMVSQMADIITNFTQVAENMKKVIDLNKQDQINEEEDMLARKKQ